MVDRRLRVLFLASYFPKPDNPLMGTWALAQAQALAKQDIDLKVVSFTSWVPKLLAQTSGAKAYANCPERYCWDGSVEVEYPRWLYYPVPPLKTWAYSNPVPYLNMAWWSAQEKLQQIIQEFQPDVLFCHHSLPNGWIVAHLPPQNRPPIITLDHDFDEIADCHHYPRRKAAMQFVSEQVSTMLAVSNRMANDLRSLFPSANVITQHNGVEPIPASFFQQKRPVELNGKKVILTCALFAERKGIPLLVEAFGLIASQHPDAILRIIGSGPEEERIKNTITDLNLAHQVHMVGKKPHHEVLQEMIWADCFALVGWDEPFATVYLEAMASGKAIICCNDGGITDVVQDGVHGYTVPPKDVNATAAALDRILSNNAKCHEMGHNAQRLISEKLTWDAKTQELIQLCKQAVDQPQSIVAV
ncbi:glycosyltransferase family 4 protein [Oculatella sp. LEGE 06141]|uniref:glycosyltransferase family 4 protein n=1 Tax=Oculatella sp. LEGE 06141 TaxID=1828648 RepID=UPI00187F9B38|nr:glycosyltransferase family 4 protein [Oculatella sp. LEGE 06141]MBE9179526.1 glycosyltransferase family 4 protein [Oculatella sp. LEGE 06141]